MLWSFYKWFRIPFGLINAPTIFQRFAEHCLGYYQDKFAIHIWKILLTFQRLSKNTEITSSYWCNSLGRMASELNRQNIISLNEKSTVWKACFCRWVHCRVKEPLSNDNKNLEEVNQYFRIKEVVRFNWLIPQVNSANSLNTYTTCCSKIKNLKRESKQ